MPGPVIQHNGVFADSVFTRPASGESLSSSILVVGGSTAAYSAALTALKFSKFEVCLVQPHKVLGGQFTTQALPASDDGNLMQRQAPKDGPVEGERFVISRSQRQFRDRQRELQRVKGQKLMNPGGCWVSPLSTSPVVAATALNEALVPYLQQDRLKLIPLAEPIRVLMEKPAGSYSRVTGCVFRDRETGSEFTVMGRVVIEATDLGDLLELGEVRSHVGQEARHETGESILPTVARPECQQSFTFCAVVERSQPGLNNPVVPPLAGYGSDPFTSVFYKKEEDGSAKPLDFFHPFGIFRYRRLLRTQEAEKTVSLGDVTVLNWGVTHELDGSLRCGNDYRPGRLVGVSSAERQHHIRQARNRALAYVHYLQTHGVPDLKLRGDLTWTADGVALDPYIREARRGAALTTIRHEDVAETFFPKQARARCFEDSVGIGEYHYLDLHGNDAPGHVSPRGKDVYALPFSLPVGALVPIETDGLILSSKSIGTTHITNAAYRMHPVEWAIGEASAFLAVLSLWKGVEPRDVAKSEAQVRQLQGFMTRNGIPIFWFDDVAHDDPDFEPIQVMAAAGIIRSEDTTNLRFRPEGNVNRAVICAALVNLLKLEKVKPSTPAFWDVSPNHWAYSVIETLYGKGIISGTGFNRFAPDQPMLREHLFFLVKSTMTKLGIAAPYDVFEKTKTPKDQQTVRRRELSRIFYELLKLKLGVAS